MTATDYLDQADRYATDVRVARDCDALDPCDLCRAKTAVARRLRRQAHVAWLAELDVRFAGSAAATARVL